MIVDILVNAENSDLEMGSGVYEVIFRRERRRRCNPPVIRSF